jgi:hypothetical protein
MTLWYFVRLIKIRLLSGAWKQFGHMKKLEATRKEVPSEKN